MTMLASSPIEIEDEPALDAVVTPEAMLDMDDLGLFELVDDQLVEKTMGIDSNWVAGRIIFYMALFLRDHPIGDVVPEQSFRCFTHKPRMVRRPDVSFLATGRLPVPWPEGHLRLTPDLAVEVVSSTDNVRKLERKLNDYRLAGIPLVWCVHPDVRMVRVHPLGGPIVELRDGDTLTGGSVLPGFSVPVLDLFPAAAVAVE